MHNFWEIIYVDKQAVTIVKDEERDPLKQGEMVFIKPNQPHFVRCGRDGANIFIISFECRSESMGFFYDKIYSVPDNLKYLLQNIMSEAKETFVIPDFNPDLHKLELRSNPNLGGEQVIKNSLELLLVYILRKANNQSSQQEFFISKSIPPRSFRTKSSAFSRRSCTIPSSWTTCAQVSITAKRTCAPSSAKRRA